MEADYSNLRLWSIISSQAGAVPCWLMAIACTAIVAPCSLMSVWHGHALKGACIKKSPIDSFDCIQQLVLQGALQRQEQQHLPHHLNQLAIFDHALGFLYLLLFS